MKMVTKWLLALVLPCFIATIALAQGYQAGKEYLVLASPQPTSSADKIEVVELFWHGCPHCYRLEPLIAEWQTSKPDDVEFIRMPAVLGPNWELYGKAYYTAEFYPGPEPSVAVFRHVIFCRLFILHTGLS